MRVTKGRYLEVLVVMVGLASLVVVAFMLTTTRLDWHSAMIGGFPAGTTPKELEAQLGAPKLIGSRATWRLGDGELLQYWQGADGNHLSGNRIRLGRAKLSEGSRQSQLQSLFGRGEFAAPEIGSLAVGLRYRDTAVGRNWRELVVRFTAASSKLKDEKIVDKFDLVWRAPNLQRPSMQGYDPGDGGYSIYPDNSGPVFSCKNLMLHGRVVVRHQSPVAEVQESLGKPVATSDDRELWGYWSPSAHEVGILVRFWGQQVDSIEVSRDWRILARELSEYKANYQP